MKTKLSEIAGLAATAGTALVLVGCVCACPENKKAGIPFIVCQPMDQLVLEGQDATFNVSAKGSGLVFEWFFENGNGVSPVVGANGPEIVVPSSTPNRYGLYWATVASTNFPGAQLIETRRASLGQAQAIAGTSTNGIDQEPLRLGSAGSAPCCSPYCGYINFYNGGAGWNLTQGQPFCFTVTGPGGVLNTTSYCSQWRYSPTGAGCTGTTTDGTIMRVIPPVTHAYVFTVYIKGNCPPAGSSYTLTPIACPP